MVVAVGVHGNGVDHARQSGLHIRGASGFEKLLFRVAPRGAGVQFRQAAPARVRHSFHRIAQDSVSRSDALAGKACYEINPNYL